MTITTRNREPIARRTPPTRSHASSVTPSREDTRPYEASGRQPLAGWAFATTTAVLATAFGVVFAHDVHSAATEVALAAFLAAAGAAVVPFAMLFASDARTDETGALVLSFTALCSAAAATIHFVAIDKQGGGYWLFVGAFAALAVFQLAWALVLLVRPSRIVYATGLLANAATVFIWAYSRGVTVPIGPDAGKPESVAFGDVVSTVLEGLIVAGAAWLLLRGRRPAAGGRNAIAAALVVAALLIPLVTLAMISSAGTDLLVPAAD